MICKTCGNDLQGNEYNCPFCGAAVDYTEAVEQAKAGKEEGFSGHRFRSLASVPDMFCRPDGGFWRAVSSAVFCFCWLDSQEPVEMAVSAEVTESG